MNKNQIKVLKEAAPYIDSFRSKKFVIVLPDPNKFSEENFNSIIEDIILLKKFGMDLILVPSISQLDGINQVVDEDDLVIIEQEIAKIKTQLIEIFKKEGFRLRFLMIASTRFGVFNGKDTNRLGQLVRIDGDEIDQPSHQNTLFVLSPIAKDKNDVDLIIHPLNLAADFASLIKAEKLIIFSKGLRNIPGSYHLDELESNFSVLAKRHHLDDLYLHFLQYQDLSAIKRTHFIEQNPESLLGEIFSIKGSGILINTDSYEQIRRATPQDAFLIEKLIEKNLKKQALIDRRGSIKRNISQYYVIDRDGFIIGTGAVCLLQEDSSCAEIYGFSIHKDYQGQGRATRLLQYLEKKAIELAANKLIVQTTRAESWYQQKGYQTKNIIDFPQWMAKKYPFNRQSKILLKSL